MVEEIYLIGTGSDKNSFDVAGLEGKVVFNFSGDLLWFQSRGIHPTYWTFIDPNTVYCVHEHLRKGLYNEEWLRGLKKSSIIYSDFQGTNKFYELGLTTTHGMEWNSGTFAEVIFPEVRNLFKESISVPTVVKNNSLDIETTDSAQLVIHEQEIVDYREITPNTDKFSCFVLPLVLWYFKDLKYINCIGFGDFSVLRDTATSDEKIDEKEYNEFISSYTRVKSSLIQLLNYKNVKIKFYNKNSSFYDLETATNG